MKQTMVSFLVLISILLLFSTSNAEFIFDTDGDILFAGEEYYILPFIRGRGGGLSMSGRPTSICPLFVAQEPLEVSSGLPVIFSTVNPRALPILQESTDLNIRFTAYTICINSNVWQLGSDESGSENLYVRTVGEIGNPGESTLNNWFSIVPYGSEFENVYKIRFCPSVCTTCSPKCGDLGVFVEGDTRWLGLNGSSFPVMFKKTNLIKKQEES